MALSSESDSAGVEGGGVVALAGGVGASRFLSGLVQVVDPREITVVSNTGDDREFYGVHVSPDLDIVAYTLAKVVDTEKGYGLAGDSFALVDQLDALGHEVWFRLGDRDFAHCLHRTLALREGTPLSETARRLCRQLGVATQILPMSDDPCPTFVVLDDGRILHFEEYLVRERSPDQVRSVDLSAAQRAGAAPGVIAAIRAARVILICPSNPVVSIGPILAIREIRAALEQTAAPIVAISPIVGGAPIKGPADRLLRGIGREVSARGVAELYCELIDGMVIDRRDTEQLEDIRALGLRATAVESLMSSPEIAAGLARSALALADSGA